MGSALETLSGQAYGAGKPHMLGIYLQRSWIILLLTALVLSTAYIFATPILKLLGQTDEIAELAGRFSIWMIPELFAFAVDFPIEKFLQAQSRVGVMAGISATVLAIHLPLSWAFIIKLNMGLVGAAITLNLAWFLLVAGQLAYLFSGKCSDAWTGFSWLALTDLVDFWWLSVASAVMLWSALFLIQRFCLFLSCLLRLFALQSNLSLVLVWHSAERVVYPRTRKSHFRFVRICT